MTTRYEAELQDIEHRLKHPIKKAKVAPAEVEHLRLQRERERDRNARTKELGTEIRCRWLDGEPVKWEPATAEVFIGGKRRVYTVQPHQEVEGKQRLDPKLMRLDYDGMVEEWALWKWHGDRGSELDDYDNYILDCEAPNIVWEEAIAKQEPKRRVRKQREVASGPNA